VELKLKIDGLIQWAALDPSTLGSLFSLYLALGQFSLSAFWLGL
jgi:hypothetical protein